MGAAVSAGSKSENSIIPLGQAHQHMHIYQHRGNGEILVLIDEDIASIEGIRPAEWDLMKVHGRQQDYFQKVKVKVEFAGNNASSLKDTLPPKSQRSADGKIENDGSNLNANNSFSTMPRTSAT